MADPLLREAILIASGSLSHSLAKIDSGAEVGEKKSLRAAISATRYDLRLGGRPTPFGLFAGVAPGRLGPSARVEVRGPGDKRVSLDSEWLTDRVLSWLDRPEVRRRVDVVGNDLCQVRDGRLVLPRPEGETSVRHTPLLAWVREIASSPLPYTGLLDAAAARCPDVPESRLDGFLAQLVRHGYLLTSITPQRVDADLLDRIEAAVSDVPEFRERLRGIRAALDDYTTAEAGRGEDALRLLLRRIDPDGDLPRPPIQVDLRVDATVVLPEAVAEEAGRYASAMWAVSPEWTTHAHMRDYRDRFIERYGMGGVVPLAELIDPHRGIGYPDGYRNPPDAAAPSANGHTSETEDDRTRRTVIAELVQEAMLGERREIELTSADIDRLTCTSLGDPPRSLEFCFQLLADSAADLDRGAFRLVSTPYAGSWVAGATAGRFADLAGLTPDLSRLLTAGADDSTVFAQLTFPPRTVRALNVVRVPRLLPYEMPIGVFADRSDPRHVDWRDLVVALDESGFQLFSGRTGRRVVPVAPYMLAIDREAPNLARLLVDIAVARPKTVSGWDWAGLESLPFLPRVSFGRVVASPRRWRPDRRMRETAADPEAWKAALEEWRARYRVPDRVQIVQQDRAYGIDLRDEWHHGLLRHEMTKGRLVLIEDLAADGRGLGWAAGHSTEVVVPLTRRETPSPPAAPLTGLRPHRPRVHLPGEEWIHAKLYAVPGTHDRLLHEHLPALLRDVDAHVDRWFFIRYRDPEWHIRLRLHGEPDALGAHVLPELARHCRAWQEAGAIRTMVMAAYEPETERYGGPDGLVPAERLFCLDSQSAIAQLRMRAQGRLELPDEVLGAVAHAILLESLGPWDWCSWIDRTFRKAPEHAIFQRHRALATDLIVPGRTAERFADRFSAPGLARLWTEAPEPRAYGDLLVAGEGPRTAAHAETVLALLHMQHNRLIGIDRSGEKAAAAILRGVARARLGRARHAMARR